MSDWDADSKQLRANLTRVLTHALGDSRQRLVPSVEQARAWQIEIMRGLTVPQAQFVGRFRGEPSLEGCEVEVGGQPGVSSGDVEEELKAFEEKLQKAVQALDSLIDPDRDLRADDVAAIIDLCAWAHSEWVRIHPFANGNGRTARLWANSLAMRYGLPPFVRLRPRPDSGYGSAAAAAMMGRWQATVPLFRQMYREAIRR